MSPIRRKTKWHDLTKRSASRIIKKPSFLDGEKGALLHIGGWPTILADFVREEVVRMWEKRLLALFSMGAVAAYHKSVLTARLLPERSTVLVDS